MTHLAWLRAAALIALVATLAACSSDPSDISDPDTQAHSGPAAGLTEPGSVLEVGDTATVTRGGADEVLEVTISDITVGRSADLEGLDRPTDDETPYYVDYELTHVSGASPYLPLTSFLSGWSGETQLTMLSVFAPFPQCEEETVAQDTPVGTTIEGCATFVTAAGEPPLDRLQFSYGDDYDSFEGDEVSWEPAG